VTNEISKVKAGRQGWRSSLEDVVNRHGSVFRPVHQEDDFGIDGFIELVAAEEVTGRLVGVQVKTGDSYLSPSGHKESC